MLLSCDADRGCVNFQNLLIKKTASKKTDPKIEELAGKLFFEDVYTLCPACWLAAEHKLDISAAQGAVGGKGRRVACVVCIKETPDLNFKPLNNSSDAVLSVSSPNVTGFLPPSLGWITWFVSIV
jgi:hypothetical protein